MLCDRHGLLMNTYGREPPSLNNESGFDFASRGTMNDADAARGKGTQPRDIGGHRHVPMSGKNAVNSPAKV